MAIGAGSQLAGYRVVSLLGRGGAGAVYLADDLRLGRKVALKVLNPETADAPGVRERFVAESRIAASLDHPHIIPIYEAGEADGQLFIAMRYVPGSDLGGAIRDGRVTAERTLRVIDQVASALDAAHEAGLIHRDVKPANILLAAGSQPGSDHAYLTDFGLTKQATYAGSDPRATKSGQLLGTIGYIAPEQIQGLPIDGRVDIYSLGCVLYECLAGTAPYPRESDLAVLLAHVEAPPPSLAATRPELPAAIDAVIAKALAKHPDERYPSAGELARAAADALAPSASRVGAITRGFLFSDLRGYTDYVDAHGDRAAADLLESYRRLVRDVVRRYGGAEIKTEGDSFYLVFPSASSAVGCGLAIAAAAETASREQPTRPIKVAIGIHAGESTRTDEGYVGLAVNTAARICAQAQAGEVLVSETVRSIAGSSHDFGFASRGKRTLKGIAEPVALYAASGPARAAATPQTRPITRPIAVARRHPRGSAALGGAAIAAVLAIALLGTSAGFGRPSASNSGSAGASPSNVGAVPSAARSSERIVWSVEYPKGKGLTACSTDLVFSPPLDARLWMMGPDGKNQFALLPTSDVFQLRPAWKPDGTSLAFVADEQNSGQNLWTAAPDGSGAKRQDTSPGADFAAVSDPAWSADSKRLVFIDGGAIVTINADGSDRVIVRQQTKPADTPKGASPAPPTDAYHAPVWLPDGRIGVVRHDAGSGFPGDPDYVPEGQGNLMVMNADASGYQALLGLELNTLDLVAARWSPDGKRILLTARRGSPDQQIWVVNSDGTGLRQLTTDGNPTGATWSPDGSSVAFSSDLDGKVEIYRMAADGSDQLRLTQSEGSVANCSPTWGRPDRAIAAPLPSPSGEPRVSPGPLTYHRGLLNAGTYLDRTFQPALGFTLPAGWEGRRNYIDGMALGRSDKQGSELDVGKVQTVFPHGCVTDEELAIGRRPADLTNWLRGLKLIKTSNLRPVNLGGYSGLRLEVEAVTEAPNCIGPSRVWLFDVGQDVLWMRKGDRYTFVVLDVRGTTVTFLYGGPPSENFQPLAEQIMQSLTFNP